MKQRNLCRQDGKFFSGIIPKNKHLFICLLTAIPISVNAEASAGSENTVLIMTSLIFQLGTIVILSRIGGLFFEKIKIPTVLGELILGVIIGPYLLGQIPLPGFPEGLFPLRGLDSIPISDNLYGIATVASIILLFVSGLETDISLLLRYSLAGTLIGIGGVIFSFFFGAGVGYFFLHKPFFDTTNLFLGVISTATSVGITARILSEKRKMDSPEGVTIMAGAVIDDVLGIILLAVITGVAAAKGKGNLETPSVQLIAIRAFLVWIGFTATGLLMAGHINRFLKRFHSNAAIAVFSLGMAFMLAGIFEKAGLAMIIGAYIMGLTLSKTDLSFSIHEALSTLYSFFVPIFFVVMGMMVNVREMADTQVLIFGLAYSVTAILAKVAGCALPSLFLNFNKLGALRIGVGMVPRGEVALIIAGIGISSGVINQTLFGATVVMTLITTLFAPPLLSLLLKGRSGVRKEFKKRTTVTTDFDFSAPELIELMNMKIVQYFSGEGFYVHTVKIGNNSVHEFRKENISISATVHGNSISFETDRKDVLFVKTIVYESLLQLHSIINKARNFLQPENIKKGLTEVQARKDLDVSINFNPSCVINDLKSTTKDEIIKELISVLHKNKLLENSTDALDSVMQREKTMSTGMQHGVAIPHGRTDAVSRITIAAGISKKGVDFQSLDGAPSHIFVLVLSPLKVVGPHIQFLASLSAALNDEDFRKRLLSARNREEIYSIFQTKLS